MASKTSRSLENRSLLLAIKDYMSRGLSEGASTDIRDLAKNMISLRTRLLT